MKVSSSLRIIPVVFAVIASIAMSVAIVSVSSERNLYIKNNEMKKLGQNLMETSDFLTEQARNYVQYGEKYYLEAYYRETQITKTREKILQLLAETGADDEEMAFVNKARELSYELEKLENEAFDMAADGDLEGARLLLYSEKYKIGKQPITEAIEVFQKMIDERYGKRIETAKNTANLALIFMCVSIAAIIAVIFVFFNKINKKIIGMIEMAQTAIQLADGNFNDIDLDKFNSNDEFGMLAKGLDSILNTVRGIENEINILVKGTYAGNMSYMAASENFKGGWAAILSKSNSAIRTVREQIIENAPVAYIITKNGIITDCNRFSYEQMGMKPGEYIESYYKDPAERKAFLKKLELEGSLKRESNL